MKTWKRRKKKNTRELYFFLLLWLSPSEKKQGRKKKRKTRQEKYSACLYLCKHNTVMGGWGAKFFNQLGTNKTHRRKQQKKNGIEFINDVAEKKKRSTYLYLELQLLDMLLNHTYFHVRKSVCLSLCACLRPGRCQGRRREPDTTKHSSTPSFIENRQNGSSLDLKEDRTNVTKKKRKGIKKKRRTNANL